MNIFKSARYLRESEMFDMSEVFKYLDSIGRGDEISEMDRISAEFEYAVVESIEFETEDCLIIYNDTVNVAVDPNLQISVYV